MTPSSVITVPWRHRLFLRLFAATSVIAVIAVGAATFATVHSTTAAVHEVQQQSLHDDASTYDLLIGYAATHHTWANAHHLLVQLARRYDVTLTITDSAGRVLAGSSKTTARLDPAQARATLDPLEVDTTLLPQPSPDPSVPATIPSPEAKTAQLPQACPVHTVGCGAFVITPTGSIDSRVLGMFDASTRRQLATAVRERVNRCLKDVGLPVLTELRSVDSAVVTYPQSHAGVARCLDESLRAVLSGYVAPSALLFTRGGPSSAGVFWRFPGRNQAQIAALAFAVLLLAVFLCAVLASRIVRPLRRMARTAELAGEGDLSARVDYRRADEIGQVARTFNAMADRREQLELARRRLVGDVSHELRTPLSNVRAWLEGAQDGLVETDRRLLDSLHEETLHLQRLVDDLADLSSADAGEFRVSPQRVDLEPFLEQVVNAFRGAAEAQQVSVRSSAGPGSTVWADPLRLRQAVGNLVANALRHTPSGGAVTIAGDHGVLAVSDTGEGIPAEEIPHLFERFRRVDASRSRGTGGSGLGLAIVAQIVRAHGGTATIQSTQGSGTTVKMMFSPEVNP